MKKAMCKLYCCVLGFNIDHETFNIPNHRSRSVSANTMTVFPLNSMLFKKLICDSKNVITGISFRLFQTKQVISFTESPSIKQTTANSLACFEISVVSSIWRENLPAAFNHWIKVSSKSSDIKNSSFYGFSQKWNFAHFLNCLGPSHYSNNCFT